MYCCMYGCCNSYRNAVCKLPKIKLQSTTAFSDSQGSAKMSEKANVPPKSSIYCLLLRWKKWLILFWTMLPCEQVGLNFDESHCVAISRRNSCDRLHQLSLCWLCCCRRIVALGLRKRLLNEFFIHEASAQFQLAYHVRKLFEGISTPAVWRLSMSCSWANVRANSQSMRSNPSNTQSMKEKKSFWQWHCCRNRCI